MLRIYTLYMQLAHAGIFPIGQIARSTPCLKVTERINLLLLYIYILFSLVIYDILMLAGVEVHLQFLSVIFNSLFRDDRRCPKGIGA